MSDADPQDGDGTPAGSDGMSQLRAHARQLEKLNKALEADKAKLEAELAESNKSLAGFTRSTMFDKLGIPDKGAGKLFREHYSGDLTEDAVRAAAAEYELLAPAAPTVPVDQAAMSRMDQVLAGTSVPPPSGAQQQLAAAKNTQELMSTLASLGLTEA